MKQPVKAALAIGTSVVTAVGLILVPAVANAATANTTINAVLAKGISVSTSGTVTLNITPTGTGSYTSAADTVTVGTNSAAGYTLKLNDNDTASELVLDGSNKLTASAGTIAAPATLGLNKFGFRLDDAAATTGFGAGPTSAQTNQASLTSALWAGVPISTNTTTNTIRVTAAANAADAMSVYYGASADFSKANGTYTDGVTYTATAN